MATYVLVGVSAFCTLTSIDKLAESNMVELILLFGLFSFRTFFIFFMLYAFGGRVKLMRNIPLAVNLQWLTIVSNLWIRVVKFDFLSLSELTPI